MASPAAVIVPDAPPIEAPPLQAHKAHWLAVLRAHFELVRAEIRAELQSDHPGSRHRVTRLLSVATNVDGQIQTTEATRATVARIQEHWRPGGPETPGSAA